MGTKHTSLKLAQIHRNESQPREHFDETELQELADSIKEHGLLQPIVVRKREAGGYEIVAGERRFRAHEIAGKITIDARIITGADGGAIDDASAFEKAMVENLNRADMLPLEEAKGFKKLLDMQGTNVDPKEAVQIVAKKVSKSVPFVNQRLALLNLRPEVAAAVNLGHIGTQAAVQIAALTKDNQKGVFEKWKKGDVTDNQLVHIAYAMRRQEKAATQESMVAVEEMTPEQKADRTKETAKTKTALDEIERLCGLLEGIAKTDPLHLSKLLAGEVGQRLEQLDRAAKFLADARFQVRQAKAHAEASDIIVNAEAEAPDLAAEAEALMAAAIEPEGDIDAGAASDPEDAAAPQVADEESDTDTETVDAQTTETAA
ncbi:ParB/RepB/Spo0J family partition protein [Streptomyces sp. NBC_00190]|uniref:ParB/RepB/Spo0J family partition protein n=1 Tax=Streptomyces sp. NBC_00190 TaxID=2903634 RepID=UPI002E2CEAD2|nr:ParB/RepB/Spo0J family partition protein [Streptomyces sp. NBC_00190]